MTKLAIISIFLTYMQAFAINSYSQQKIDLDLKGVEIITVIKKIETKYNYRFVYSIDVKESKQKVDIHAERASIDEVMDKLLDKTVFSYKKLNNQLVVLVGKLNDINAFLPITGRVTDTEGVPIAGASIQEIGTNNGTVTGTNGSFEITVVNKAARLVVSAVGYFPQELRLDTTTNLNVVLVRQISEGEEVIVIAYGSEKKKDLTGSVGVVKVDELAKAPVANFSDALGGRIAGVNVASNDGQPGSVPNIVIRGSNSLTQTDGPLYVVDGFPMESLSQAAVNPNDIESMTVLKDASATAIYGARGANGVIVIETKRGKISKPVINYVASYGFQKVTKTMELMNPYEFVKYQKELVPWIAAESLLDSIGMTLEDYRGLPGTDVQDKYFRVAPLQSHNLSMRGGQQGTRYSASGTYFDQDGIIVNSGGSKYQIRASLDQTISKKLKTGFVLSYMEDKFTGKPVKEGISSAGYAMYSVWGWRPTWKGKQTDFDYLDDPGDATFLSARINPVESAKNEYVQNLYKSLYFNSYITYEIIKGLNLRISGGVNKGSSNYRYFYNSKTNAATPANPSNIRGSYGGINQNESNSWLNENTLNYNRTINKNNRFDALAGITFQQYRSAGFGLDVEHVKNESLVLNDIGSGTATRPRSSNGVNRLNSVLGRFNYYLKSKYIFTTSFRADGSSKFKDGNRWSFFPSGAFAWRIIDEPFLKNSKTISDAKLRTSYGITGNNRIGNFDYLPRLVLSPSNGYSWMNADPTLGLVSTTIGNPDLRWENTEQTDLGLDLAFFSNRITFHADVYQKITSNLLLNARIAPSSGYTSINKNIGKISNRGVELTLGLIPVKGKYFSWESNFNIAFNKTKVLQLVEGQESLNSSVSWEYQYNAAHLYIARLGQPASMFYGYIWDGNYQYSDFDEVAPGQYVLKATVSPSGNTRANTKPGDIKYRDINGDKVVNAMDQTVIGNPNPIHIGGLSNNFSYKNVSLNVFFQWSYGNDVFNANRVLFEGNGQGRPRLNQFASYANRWTADNQNNELFRAGGGGPMAMYSSRTIEDGSFLRLKTIAIEYSVPTAISKKAWINNLSFNLTAQNLITWTKYSGLDPEVSTRHTILTPGFDFSPYPRSRTIVFGINATF